MAIKQETLFATEEMDTGQLAKWRDLERKQRRDRLVLSRTTAVLLRAGWRLRVEGGTWTATHPEHGKLSALRADLLLAQVRDLCPVAEDQLDLFSDEQVR